MTNLPQDLVGELMSLLRGTEDGEYEILDKAKMLDFVRKNADSYPFLREFIRIDEQALADYVERTGDVPPGVKLTRRTQEKGSNVTRVEIVRGPGRVRPK